MCSGTVLHSFIRFIHCYDDNIISCITICVIVIKYINTYISINTKYSTNSKHNLSVFEIVNKVCTCYDILIDVTVAYFICDVLVDVCSCHMPCGTVSASRI